MKLLHITDIHGDLEALNSAKNYAQKRNDLELILCSGDYIGECLNKRDVEKMQAAVNFIRSNIRINEPVPFAYVLQHILKEEAPEGLKKAANDYIEIVKEFDENAEEQYRKVIDVFKQFPQQVLTVPGNWDSPHYFKFFEEYDIHGKSKEIAGIKFAGYGSANMLPVFLPYVRFIDFSEEELYDFLTEEDSDVVVSHIAPFGLQDKGSERDHDGSWAYLDYIGRESPILCLVGHSHEARGISKDKDVNTFVINPGNLGHYEGSPNSGTFYEIELSKQGIISAVPYKILGEEAIREDEYVDSINGKGKIEKEAGSSIIEIP